MTSPLIHQLSHHQYLRQKLEEQFPDIDEETLLDTLEGITSLHEMIAEVVRSRQDDLAFIAAVRARISDMQDRLARLDRRAEKEKEIVASVLERAGIKKITEADFTLSLRTTNPPLVVIEEKQIPEAYWKPQPPKLDRQGLISALNVNGGAKRDHLGGVRRDRLAAAGLSP